jgi:uncharacterized protein (DUF1778 family)
MTIAPSDRRLNMRLSAEQEDLLRIAAARQGQSLSGFVLGAATDRARDVVDKADRIGLTQRGFARFIKALDAPVEPMPILRRYAPQ